MRFRLVYVAVRAFWVVVCLPLLAVTSYRGSFFPVRSERWARFARASVALVRRVGAVC